MGHANSKAGRPLAQIIASRFWVPMEQDFGRIYQTARWPGGRLVMSDVSRAQAVLQLCPSLAAPNLSGIAISPSPSSMRKWLVCLAHLSPDQQVDQGCLFGTRGVTRWISR